ncbi:E3 ubiquitin-protein ligase [Acrasis kona]|uniref:E3 ubiquitin-protein ligase n=1 Tax=Acrasis kona TaxID=1008807 RepID=A0AAW2ZNH0_9EUKA
MIAWIILAIVLVILGYKYLRDNNVLANVSINNKAFSPFRLIADKYKTIDEVEEALRTAGLESSNLIIGIDYTASNEYQGRKTFNGMCLHKIQIDGFNPYQNVIKMVAQTLEKFDEDRLIPVFGFGDYMTKDHSVFPFLPDPHSERYCHGVEEVLQVYNKITPGVTLSGPTNFAPLIKRSIDTLFTTDDRSTYHILVSNERETRDAIVEASKFPLSIILVGVGDGPWETMNDYDDGLPTRKFDNFQFVDYNKVLQESRRLHKNPEVEFTVAALMEIPEQYNAIKKLGLLGRSRHELSNNL